DKLNLIAPVLFDREPRMGFEPEGSYQQFNDVFAEMVAWHNAAGITGSGHFVISRPDVDLHRQRSEQYYHEYIRQQKSISGGHGASYAPVQDNEWTPPSPGM
ncbi:relaxase NikB, partial [Escherichia coli]|nr:relaxase NikB [Escherichia coli]